MISAALEGKLDNIKFNQDDIFGVSIPESVPNVPKEVLTPKNTWDNKSDYTEKALYLARKFNENFSKYKSYANEEILAGAPKEGL